MFIDKNGIDGLQLNVLYSRLWPSDTLVHC